jgi:hypothetical protein
MLIFVTYQKGITFTNVLNFKIMARILEQDKIRVYPIIRVADEAPYNRETFAVYFNYIDANNVCERLKSLYKITDNSVFYTDRYLTTKELKKLLR